MWIEHKDRLKNDGVPEITCERCDKTFVNKAALSSHMHVHGGPMIKCRYCQYKTPRKADLTKHVYRLHTF